MDNTTPNARSLPLMGGAASAPQPTSSTPATGPAKGDALSLDITGMSCGHCVNAVRNALAALPGVAVDDVQIGKAHIHLDSSAGSRTAVIDTLAEEGYPAEFAGS